MFVSGASIEPILRTGAVTATTIIISWHQNEDSEQSYIIENSYVILECGIEEHQGRQKFLVGGIRIHRLTQLTPNAIYTITLTAVSTSQTASGTIVVRTLTSGEY